MLRLNRPTLAPTLMHLCKTKFREISSSATSNPSNTHRPNFQSLNLVARNQLEAVVRDRSIIDVSKLPPPVLGTLANLPSGDFIIYPSFLSADEQKILLTSSLAKLGGKRRRRRPAIETTTPELPVYPSWRAAAYTWADIFGADKDYEFEEGHFDGVIRDYREITVSSWPDSSPPELSHILLRLYGLIDSSNNPPSPGLTTPPNIQTHILHLASTGEILPHVDNVEASGSVIAGVSLGNTRVLRLSQSITSSEDASFDVLLESGSVYIQRDNVRYKWKHEIPNISEFQGRRVGGGQRVSIMLRSPKQKNTSILPAFLIAIISIAAVNIFVPNAVATLYDAFTIPFKSSSTSESSVSPFDVIDIPGRGKGIIANRNIKQGELLIKEKPLFIVPTRPGMNPSELIRSTVAALAPTDRTAFFALSYAKPNVSTPDIPFEIFQTNAISAGHRGTGLFPRTARLNHGCSKAFAAVYNWRDAEGILVVHAIRDISKGQEILTTYTDTKRRRSERQAHLRAVYHFDCACSVCALPKEESAASDRRLGQMADAYSMFSMWGSDSIKGTEAIKLARRIWSTGGTEGYISERGQLAADAAHVAAAHADAKAARQWATLANKWYGIELGADSQQCETAQAIMRSPESHGAWGTRKPELVGGPEGLS
ncbi:unnamed protein product [Rhizoctonia solani]|uniref:SET domain-containing protein n=1 Tax=Rhizoctonia solani TaxID=456999 RepID=A0A8H3E160_9AGAM|nr:unnamed protein product [Rhizoctonia solani]